MPVSGELSSPVTAPRLSSTRAALTHLSVAPQREGVVTLREVQQVALTTLVAAHLSDIATAASREASLSVPAEKDVGWLDTRVQIVPLSRHHALLTGTNDPYTPLHAPSAIYPNRRPPYRVLRR